MSEPGRSDQPWKPRNCPVAFTLQGKPRVEVLFGHSHKKLVLDDSRVGDQNLDRTVFRLGLCEGQVDLVGVGDVTLN